MTTCVAASETPHPVWTAFLERVAPDPELRAFLQRFCGYCGTGVTTEHKFVFAYGTGAQRGQWRALIAILESLLRLHRHRTGNLVRLDEYLYRRSGGVIGSLSQLVRGAAILAIEDGSEQISKQLLDSVPVDYAAERADTASRPPRRGSRAIRRQSG